MPTSFPQPLVKDGRGDSIAVPLQLCHMGTVEHVTRVDVEVDIVSVSADKGRHQKKNTGFFPR